MKSVKIAAVILVLTLTAVIANAIILRNLIDGLTAELEEADGEEYEEVFEHFKRIKTYVGLSVDHEDMMNIELAFAELVGAADAEDEDSAAVVKSRLKYSLEHLKRLSGLNIDSIF